MNKKRIYIASVAMMALSAWAQTLPTVGVADADQHIVTLSQSGWQPAGATLSYDAQTLYLSLMPSGKVDHDLYVSRKQNGKWQTPEVIVALQSPDDEVGPTISPDEQTIYFVRESVVNAGTRKERRESNLYNAQLQPDGTWQTPQMLVISNGTDKNPRILQDGQTLVFSSIRSNEKKAEEKRYYIRHLDKYNWTLPHEIEENASESQLQEAMMSVSGIVTDQQTGQGMEARVDVYDAVTQQRIASHRTDESGAMKIALEKGRKYRLDAYRTGYTHCYYQADATSLSMSRSLVWNTALSRNLSLRLTTYDAEVLSPLRPDVTVCDAESGRELQVGVTKGPSGDCTMSLPIGKHYAIRLRQDAYADTTMYIDTRKDVLMSRSEVDMLMRVGHVDMRLEATDAETGLAIATELRVINLSADAADMEVAMPKGLAEMRMRCATQYKLVLDAPGYFYTDTVVTMPGREQRVGIRMQQRPLKEEMVVELKNIEFEFNSYLLTEASYAELQQVADLMRKNPDMRIELSAHTDDIGSDSYNKRLSQKRGEAAVRYLVDNEGIDEERLTAVGYGKDKPIVPNDSDENRARNRRVEFSILKL